MTPQNEEYLERRLCVFFLIGSLLWLRKNCFREHFSIILNVVTLFVHYYYYYYFVSCNLSLTATEFNRETKVAHGKFHTSKTIIYANIQLPLQTHKHTYIHTHENVLTQMGKKMQEQKETVRLNDESTSLKKRKQKKNIITSFTAANKQKKVKLLKKGV